MKLFDPNKRGAYPVVRSRWPYDPLETTQERKESIYAVIAVAFVLLTSLSFLLAWWLS